MMTISYEYEGALYVNLTNRCDCACVFCLRHNGHKAPSTPTTCGWSTSHPAGSPGQPAGPGLLPVPGAGVLRLRRAHVPHRRHRVAGGRAEKAGANLHRCASTPTATPTCSWAGTWPPCSRGALTPSPSPSTLHAGGVLRRHQAPPGHAAWDAMLDFARECKEYVPHVVMTIVDKDKTPEEITRCRRLTEDLGVTLRIRAYIPD